MVGAGQDRAETRRLAAGPTRRCSGSTGSSRPSCPPLVAAPRRLPRHLRRRPEGAAGGAEQGLPGRRRRLRGRHLGHPAAAATRSATPPCSSARATPTALAAALRALADDAPALAKLRAAARDRARERFAPAVVGHAPLRACALRARRSRRDDRPPLPPLAPRAWLRWDLVDRLRRRAAPGHASWRSAAARARWAPGWPGARTTSAVEPDPTSCAVAEARVAAGRRHGAARRPHRRPGRPAVRPGLRVRGARAHRGRRGRAGRLGAASSGPAGTSCSRCRRSSAGSARWTSGSGTTAGTTRTSWPPGWSRPGWSSRG